MSDKLLVTGASGHLGRLVLDKLLERGVAASRIIATTRDPAKLADYATKGIEVRKADFSDPATLPEAFKGAARLALISTDAVDGVGTRIQQHANAIEAAVAAGVQHVVYTSMPNPGPDSKVTFAADHRLTEEKLKASGLGYTILRNAWYQEYLALLGLPSALASGHWYTSAGDGKVTYVSRIDCAEALAAALASDDTRSATYTLTGPEKLTTKEIAALASEILGKPLEVIFVSDEQLGEGMKAAGVPEVMIPFLVGLEANTREGGLDLQTGDVEALTGRKPRSVRAYFEENKAAFGI